MSLKAVVTKAEFEALAEPIRALYVVDDANPDVYVLDAEVDAHPKVGGLKTALQKEREGREAAAKEEKRLKALYGDLDPEKARAALAKELEQKDKELFDAGKMDELFAQKTDRMRKDHEGQVQTFQQQLTDADGRIKTLSGRLRTMMLDGGIRDAAIAAGVKPEHIDDVITRMTIRGVEGVKWDLHDDEKIVALRSDGSTQYGKDASKPMSIGEGLEVLRKTVSGFFTPSTGGGATNSSAKQVGNQFVISGEDAKDTTKYRQARAVAEKSGQQLVIAS